MVSDFFPYTRGALDVRLLIKQIWTLRLGLGFHKGKCAASITQDHLCCHTCEPIGSQYIVTSLSLSAFMNDAGQKTNEPHLRCTEVCTI